MADYIDTDTDTVTTDSERPPNRIEIDFSSTAFEKIPLWKSWASKGKFKEAIDQLLFLEKQTRPGTNIDTTTRIVVAIVQIYFEAKNWPALNEQILRLAKKRSQPKQVIVKMVQECLTFVDKIPDNEKKIKLIETLSFVTEGRPYLQAETILLINLLKTIKAELENNPSIHEATNIGQNVVNVHHGNMQTSFSTEMADYIETDTDTVTTDSERPPNRIEVDFSSTAFEKIPLWKSWASKGRVKEAIDQLLFLEKQTRPGTNIDTTARIVVAIVQIYFEAKNWPALNEQILRLAKKRSQPKQVIVKMVQECLTFVDKIPDNEKKIKLIETLSFVTEGRPYLQAETTLLINLLKKITAEQENNPSINEAANISQNVVPLNYMDSTDGRQMVKAKKRKSLDSQSKEIVYNLYKYFNDIKDKDMSSVFDTTSSKLVSISTGIPWSNVKKVMLEGKRIEKGEQGGEFSSPKNLRKRRCALNDSDRAVVRESIIDFYYDYYNKDQVFPCMKSFHEKMKEKINYSGTYKALRRELSLMGFHWKIIHSRSGILVEKNEVRFLRINFLNKIAEYRAQGRPIVFTGETFIDTAYRPKRTTKGHGLVIVHAGGKDGFVPNALYMFESQENNDEDLHYLNSQDYVKWINNQLIPNLKPNSIVVVDNTFYQNLLHNPAPESNAHKQEMLDWLEYRNIVHSSSMLKPQLYQLILQHKENFKEYKIDSLLRSNNHGVLRLPPCHPELNPIRNIWPLIKQGVGKKKDLVNVENKMKLAEGKINSITLQQWKNLCDLAMKNEKKFIGHDAAIDALTEKLDLNASDSSEESETELDIDYPMSDT